VLTKIEAEGKEGAAGFDATGKVRWKIDVPIESVGLVPQTGAVIWIETRTDVVDAASGAARAELATYVRTRKAYGRPPPPVPPGVPADVILAYATSGYPIAHQVESAVARAAGPWGADARNGDVSVVDRKTGEKKTIGHVSGTIEQLMPTRGGAFLAVRETSSMRTHVFRTDLDDGKPHDALFTLPGWCTLDTGEHDALRLATCDKGLFDVRGAGTPSFVPRQIIAFEIEPADIEGPDGTAFHARCGLKPPVTLGTPKTGPSPAQDDPDYDRHTSSDGALEARFGPRVSDEYTERVSLSGTSTRVEILRTAGAQRVRFLDQGELVQSFSFHPGGMLVVSGVTTVKIWNPQDGALARTLPGDRFTITDDGRWLFVSSPSDIAIYEWSSMRLVGRWAGSYRGGGISANGSFAMLREVAPTPGTFSHHVVGIRVVDLRWRNTRLSVRMADAGFAFSPDERTFALAPVAVQPFPISERLAPRIELIDLAIGLPMPSLEAAGGAKRPFFAKSGDVVGFHTPGGVRLVRRSDGRIVDVRAFEEAGRCAIFAVTPEGEFEGDPSGALGFRRGSDLRTSEVVIDGPLVESRRRKDLVAALLTGP